MYNVCCFGNFIFRKARAAIRWVFLLEWCSLVASVAELPFHVLELIKKVAASGLQAMNAILVAKFCDLNCEFADMC